MLGQGEAHQNKHAGPLGRIGWCLHDIDPENLMPLLDLFLRGHGPMAEDRVLLAARSPHPRSTGFEGSKKQIITR